MEREIRMVILNHYEVLLGYLAVTNLTKSVEYFCNNCGQLRLSVDNERPTNCKNCRSCSIIIGQPGKLNKGLLKTNWNKEN